MSEIKRTSRAICGTLLIAFSVSTYAGEGHDAGYNWASENGIDDPDNCSSRDGGSINNSPSFTEGCLQYLQDSDITNDDDDDDDTEE